MKKRIVATALWLYAGWYAGAMLAFVFGLSPALAPILGIAAAAIIGVDPRHVIWTRASVNRSAIASRLRAVSNPA